MGLVARLLQVLGVGSGVVGGGIEGDCFERVHEAGGEKALGRLWEEGVELGLGCGG